jgi:uncharacterized protein YlxW (UPF0749 family)
VSLRGSFRRRPTSRGMWTALVPVVALVAGLLFATSGKTALGTDLRAGESTQLSSLVGQRNQVIARQQEELARLQARVQQLTDQAASRNGAVAEAQAGGTAGMAAAELTAVSGPGVQITLDDAPRDGGGGLPSGARPDDLVIHQSDVQGVVNALWAAGAEAISIDGQRLGPTSAIRFAGEAVLVDFNPVTNPYEISAIGDRDALSRAFLASPQIRALASIAESFGLRFEFAKENDLSLPAASTPELRSAGPLSRERAASTPDPSPGG